MPQEQKFLTSAQFAKKAGIPSSKVSQLIREGKIEAVKVSGRWRIDPGQLKTARAQKPGKRAPAKRAKASPKAAPQAQKAQAASSQKHYSISEFAAMTYLTETGVKNWLKTGRLKGQIEKKGQWSVDAANLEVADISRLLRK